MSEDARVAKIRAAINKDIVKLEKRKKKKSAAAVVRAKARKAEKERRRKVRTGK